MQLIGWLVVLLGCGGQPASLADCARLRDAVDREDCRLRFLGEHFEAGDEVAFQQGLAQLEDPLARDLVRLRLAVDAPDRAGWLCEQVETQGARERFSEGSACAHARRVSPLPRVNHSRATRSITVVASGKAWAARK